MEEKSIYFIFNIVPQFTLFEYLNCWLISFKLTHQNYKKRPRALSLFLNLPKKTLLKLIILHPKKLGSLAMAVGNVFDQFLNPKRRL